MPFNYLILTDDNVCQPDSDIGEEELFFLPRCLSALADNYPSHLNTALQLWLLVHLVGDAVSFLIPGACYLIDSCTETCCDEFQASMADWLVKELGVGLADMVLHDKSPSIPMGTKEDNEIQKVGC